MLRRMFLKAGLLLPVAGIEIPESEHLFKVIGRLQIPTYNYEGKIILHDKGITVCFGPRLDNKPFKHPPCSLAFENEKILRNFYFRTLSQTLVMGQYFMSIGWKD